MAIYYELKLHLKKLTRNIHVYAKSKWIEEQLQTNIWCAKGKKRNKDIQYTQIERETERKHRKCGKRRYSSSVACGLQLKQ